jgi:hypothetical protein
MSKKNPAEAYSVNEANTFQGEACGSGANEPESPTVGIILNDDGSSTDLPPSEQRPDH